MAWQAEATNALGCRFVEALRGDDRDEIINDVLIPELNHSTSKSELVALVEYCAEKQSLLRERYSRAVGFFCIRLIDALSTNRCESWPAMIASLRLLEGVVLLFMTGEEERPYVCSLLQQLLKVRYLPRNCVARLECALMSLSEPLTRSFCAADHVPKQAGVDVMEKELLELVESSRPPADLVCQRHRVYELFDKVINECFGVHGKQFGSAVNGFQTTLSDIDIMVLLPHSVQDQLIAEATRKRDEGLDAVEEAAAESAGVSPPPASDWSFLSSNRKTRVASVAAARTLSVNLRRAGLHVCEVIEAARVPLVKCKHVVGPSDDQDSEESIYFEVDISFCNEVAWFNSHLLKAYSEFDERALQLGVLVKLWAKRRKINSAFEGTLSSYSYVLLVIHYLQYRGILPNLQRPPQEVLDELGATSIERSIEGGHNVWFVDPQQTNSDSDSACAVAGGANQSSSTVRNKAWWVGCVPPRVGILDLLYGFIRYFALEFNVYADVVSIRWRDPCIPTKMDYFSVFGEDEDERSEAGEEDMEVEEEEPVPEDASSPMADSHETSSLLSGCSQMPSSLLSTSCGDEVFDQENLASNQLEMVSRDEAEDVSMETFVGRVTSYSHEDGRGSIHCAEASTKYADEVLLSSSEWKRGDLSVGSVVQFSIAEALDGGVQASNVQIVEESLPFDVAVDSRAPQLGRILGVGKMAYPKLPSTLIGTVKTFKEEVGYGFITCPAVHKVYGRDTFLHRAQAGSLSVGDRVSFMVQSNAKGHPQARQVAKVSDDENETDIQEIACATEKQSTAVDDTRAAQRAALAEKRLRNRQCLCIDDPMEHNRTLGVTFSGQEAIAHELRRALSILKRGGDGAVNAVFKDKSEEIIASKKNLSYKHMQRQRDYSPTPLQSLLPHSNGEYRISVEVERPLRKGDAPLVIGKHGATINKIKEASGCNDVHVIDTKNGPCLYAKGPPPCVQLALEYAEQAMTKQRHNRGSHPGMQLPGMMLHPSMLQVVPDISRGKPVAQVAPAMCFPQPMQQMISFYPRPTPNTVTMYEYACRPPQPPPPVVAPVPSAAEMAATLVKPVRQAPVIDTKVANSPGSSGMLSTTPPPEALSLFSSPHASMKLSTSPLISSPLHPSASSMHSPPSTPSKVQPASHASESSQHLWQLLKENCSGESHTRPRTPPRPRAKEVSATDVVSAAASISSSSTSWLRPPDSPDRARSSQPSTPLTSASKIRTTHPPGAVTMSSLEAEMELKAVLAAKQQTSASSQQRSTEHRISNRADNIPPSLKSSISKYPAPPDEPSTLPNNRFLRDHPVVLQRRVHTDASVHTDTSHSMRDAPPSSEAVESSSKTSESASREAEIARRKKGTKIRT